MLKFLLALAELFSSFSAKLHDMSEDMPAQLTASEVREIVQEAINDGDITIQQDDSDDGMLEADDIRDFSHSVCNEIRDYDFDQILADYAFKQNVTNMVFTYCEERGIDTRSIYMNGEVDEMMGHLNRRRVQWEEWAEKEAERVKRVTIRKYEHERHIVECGGVEPTKPADDGGNISIKI